MKVVEVDLSTDSAFTRDYLNDKETIERFFDYGYDDESLKKRADELYGRSFQREALANYFQRVYEQLPNGERAAIQIEKLKDSRSLVVVGGQQAGLLTGPLYTVYKAMTIIQLAKEQEKKLGVPVVPIFWVAGEDHDLDEVRFVFKENNGRWQKHMYDYAGPLDSASNIVLDQTKLRRWLKELFATFRETEHTKALFEKTEQFAQSSTTFVDFFIKTMNWIFEDEGLLFLDAHAPAIRRLEIGYFEKLISGVETVQKAQRKGVRAFVHAGYGEEPIETDATNAHLFLRVNGERKRLDYENGKFFVKGTDLIFSKEALIDLLHQKPEWFSNNVVTRPLMQEWLLPVLAFVAGPGELKYWATLRDVFSTFQLTMPPVIPRVTATFVPRHIQKWLAEHRYDVKPFLEGKMEELRERWYLSVNDYPIAEVIERAKKEIDAIHKDVRQLAKEIDPLLAVLSEKNAAIILKQLDFIGQKMDFFVRQKYDAMLSKFSEADHWLYPEQLRQERVIHPFLLINEIGIETFRYFLSKCSTLSLGHKVVYL